MAFTIALAAAGCSDKFDVNNDNGGNQADWLIPVGEIFQGAPRDGIPSVDRPQFIPNAEVNFMLPGDLVVGIKAGSEVRGYPHPILDWHELVNDKIANDAFTLTYCPLTGTAIGWSRVVDGKETTYGVSGFLYNTNLMPYDRSTSSIWSQMRLDCVNGPLKGSSAGVFQLIETNWTTWKEMYPNAQVMSTNTGFDRPYGSFPYGSYREPNSGLLFPVDQNDTRLPNKDRVVGLAVGDQSKVYRILEFPDTVGVINDSFNATNVVAVGSAGKNFGMVYGRDLPDGTTLTFSAEQNTFPAVMIDNEGSEWDLFGDALSGPRVGQSLPRTDSYIAYWFGWVTFHPGAAIHGR
ncbi:MAG: DUF3179 domain-containing protein [Candidatus Zixiibacteriota bacterium]